MTIWNKKAERAWGKGQMYDQGFDAGFQAGGKDPFYYADNNDQTWDKINRYQDWDQTDADSAEGFADGVFERLSEMEDEMYYTDMGLEPPSTVEPW